MVAGAKGARPRTRDPESLGPRGGGVRTWRSASIRQRNARERGCQVEIAQLAGRLSPKRPGGSKPRRRPHRHGPGARVPRDRPAREDETVSQIRHGDLWRASLIALGRGSASVEARGYAAGKTRSLRSGQCLAPNHGPAGRPLRRLPGEFSQHDFGLDAAARHEVRGRERAGPSACACGDFVAGTRSFVVARGAVRGFSRPRAASPHRGAVVAEIARIRALQKAEELAEPMAGEVLPRKRGISALSLVHRS